MADARAQALPLLSVGNSDEVIHDWNYLFGRLGWLSHDIQIAHGVRVIGQWDVRHGCLDGVAEPGQRPRLASLRRVAR